MIIMHAVLVVRFFRCDLSVIFLLRHFLFCLIVVLKLAVTVFISLYLHTL